MKRPFSSFATSLLGGTLVALLVACSSDEISSLQQPSGSGGSPAATGGSPGSAGDTATGGAGGSDLAGTGGGTGVADAACIGWASVDALGQNGTTGGGAESALLITNESEFSSNASGTVPRVLRLTESFTGSVNIGSNKTIIADPGVVFTGHLGLSGSSNVILRNLTVVGNNCTDSPADCSGGADAISVNNAAHHVCFDHCDVSDGSDGNLDITEAADYVTIAWSRFSYSSRRAGGHLFSNLIGAGDTATGDIGHLKVTIHHSWWADNVNQRMPRVRFGQVHLFNNLYTSTSSSYCVGVGFDANIRLENNVFIGGGTPINTTSYENPASVVASFGNLYQNNSGSHADLNPTAVFTPPYPYTLDDATAVEAAVRSGAGPE